LSEINAGEERGHWIWYVFPQLSGLGHSASSRMDGIDGVAEAENYLRDPLVRSRLLTIATAVAEQVSQGWHEKYMSSANSGRCSQHLAERRPRWRRASRIVCGTSIVG